MIQVQTILNVADNSGGKLVKCLKILKKGAKSRYANVGDLIVVSVKQLRLKNKYLSKVKKGDVLTGVIVKTKQIIKRSSGFSLKFSTNSVVLLNKQLKPIASRVIGLMPKEIKKKKFSKIISLSAGIV